LAQAGPVSAGKTETSRQITLSSDLPLLIGSYVSSEEEQKDNPTCVFENGTETPVGSDLRHPVSCSIRPAQACGPCSRSRGTIANRTGIIDLSHRLTGNRAIAGRTVATGNLAVVKRSGWIRVRNPDSSPA
jgi:hypothetical protein